MVRVATAPWIVAVVAALLTVCGPARGQDSLKHTLSGDYIIHYDGYNTMTQTPSEPVFDKDPTNYKRRATAQGIHIGSDRVYVFGGNTFTNDTSKDSSFTNPYVMQLSLGDTPTVLSYKELDMAQFAPGGSPVLAIKVLFAVSSDAVYIGMQTIDENGNGITMIKASLDFNTIHWTSESRKKLQRYDTSDGVTLEGICADGDYLALTGVYVGNKAAYGIALQADTGKFLWDAAIESADRPNGRDTDEPRGCHVSVEENKVIFFGGSYGDMDGDSIATGGRSRSDSYFHTALLDGTTFNKMMLSIQAPNFIYDTYVRAGKMYAVGQLGSIKEAAAGLAMLRADAGVKTNAVARMWMGAKDGDEPLGTDLKAVYATPQGNLISVGTTTSRLITAETEKPNYRSVVLMTNSDLNIEYLRYELALLGSSTQNALSCTDTVCYSAGTYTVADRTRSVPQIIRTPLCSNGSRLSNETNWAEQLLTEHNTCYYCEPGHYQDEPLQYSCKECQPGSYAPTTGYGTCLLCDAGQYQPYNQSTSCYTCGLGYYSETGASNCTACPAGSYGDTAGAGQCTPCPAGSASADVGATSSSVCQQCGIGTYQPNAGQTSCLPAPEGYYSNSTSATRVYPCGVGTAVNSTNSISDAACVACSPGTYAPNEGTAVCSPCPLGTWNNITNATACNDCPAFTQGNDTGLTECYSCPPGSANPKTGQKYCPLCARGTYQPGVGQGECLNCEVDHFSALEGAAGCHKCPEFSSTLQATASDSMFSCVCNEGYFGLPGLGRRCQECPPGATCKSKDRYPRMDPGQWQDTTDVNTIFSCHPRDACPGGTPPLPEPNITAAVTHPDDVVLKSVGVSGMHTLAVEQFGYAAETIAEMSTDSYTTSCEVGYTNEACSQCEDGYYRSKGKCVECGVETPFDSAAVMSIYVVAWVLIVALLALGVLLAGGWTGTVAVVVEEHRKKIMQLLHAEDAAESAAEVRTLAAHGVVARQTEAGDAILSGGGRTEGLYEGVEVASQCESLARATAKKQRSFSNVVDTLMRPEGTEPVGSESETTGDEEDPPSKFRIVRLVMRVKEFFMGIVDGVTEFVDRNFGLAQPVRDQDAAYVLERRSFLARVKSVVAKLIRFGQLSSVILNIKITWPSALVSLGSALQMANFDTNDVISYQCVTGANAGEAYVARYYARILLPLALLLPALVYALVVGLSGVVMKYCIRRQARRSSAKRARSRSDAPDPASEGAQVSTSASLVWWARVFRTMEASTDAFVMIFLVLSTYAFTTFHVAVVEIFTCAERVSGKFYLAAEPGVQCFTTGTWMHLLPVSLIGFVLLSLGTPMVLALIIFSRHGKRDNITVQKRYSFLWASFREDKYWYMLVIIFFNWVVVMMMPLSLLSSGDQLAAMLFVLIMFFLAQQLWLPYKIPSDNNMEVTLLTTLILLDLVGIVFYTNDSDSDGGMSAIGQDFLGYLMVIVIISTVMYFIYTLAGGQVISIRLARKWRGRGEAKQAKRDFMAACLDGELEMVKPNTSGPGEWMSAYVSEEASAPEDLQGLVMHTPPNVHWLGDGDLGQAVFVPSVYLQCLSKILAMMPEENGGDADSHLEDGGGPDCAECLLVGEPGAGKTMFTAFLCGVGLGGLPGLPEGAIDVVYVQYKHRVVVYHVKRRHMKAFKGPSALHKAGLAFKKGGGNRGVVASRGLHIVDRNAGPSVRTSPPGTVLRVRTLRPANADFEDMRTLAYGSSTEGAASNAVYLSPWSLHDILLWCQFVASSRTDEPAAFIDILRSWMAQGGRVPDPELTIKAVRSTIRSQAAKLDAGSNDGIMDVTSSGAELASFLNNLFCAAPDLWAFEKVARQTRERPRGVGVVMRSQVVCNEVTCHALGDGDVDRVARLVDGMTRLSDLDNSNSSLEPLLLCGLQRQLMFALINMGVPRGATFMLFNRTTNSKENLQQKLKRMITRQQITADAPQASLPSMARRVYVLDSSAARSLGPSLDAPQNPYLEPFVYYQVVDSHDEAAAGDLALQRAGRTSLVNGFCLLPSKKKEAAKVVIFMLASSVSSAPALKVHSRQIERIVEEVDSQWISLAPMMDPTAAAASTGLESRKSRGLRRFFTRKDVNDTTPSLKSVQSDQPLTQRSPSSSSVCSETGSTTELLEAQSPALSGPMSQVPSLKAMAAIQLSSPALSAHSKSSKIYGESSKLPFEVNVYHVATPGQASSGMVNLTDGEPSVVSLERGVNVDVLHQLVGLSTVEATPKDIE